MRRKIENKRITISITLDKDIFNIVNDNYSNRSKFLENLIIEELCKDSDIKEELKKIKVVI
ncbi:hypothetical protein M0Q50_07245 [bacterium]|jgi:metal-responsive CopG/Arc/MetJ family transcriptional regulator|nr:hypothetical protein [bacterium]